MISAAEALLLPRSMLTDEERTRVALLEIEVNNFILERIEYCGCQDFQTGEQSGNVIAAVNQALRAAGWITNWAPTYGKPEHGRQALTGWRLALTPNDAAYAQAATRRKN